MNSTPTTQAEIHSLAEGLLGKILDINDPTRLIAVRHLLEIARTITSNGHLSSKEAEAQAIRDLRRTMLHDPRLTTHTRTLLEKAILSRLKAVNPHTR